MKKNERFWGRRKFTHRQSRDKSKIIKINSAAISYYSALCQRELIILNVGGRQNFPISFPSYRANAPNDCSALFKSQHFYLHPHAFTTLQLSTLIESCPPRNQLSFSSMALRTRTQRRAAAKDVAGPSKKAAAPRRKLIIRDSSDDTSSEENVPLIRRKGRSARQAPAIDQNVAPRVRIDAPTASEEDRHRQEKLTDELNEEMRASSEDERTREEEQRKEEKKQINEEINRWAEEFEEEFEREEREERKSWSKHKWSKALRKHRLTQS